VDVPNWSPYCFIENNRTVGIPSEFLSSRLVGNNLVSFSGPAMPYWHFEQLLPTWAKTGGDRPAIHADLVAIGRWTVN